MVVWEECKWRTYIILNSESLVSTVSLLGNLLAFSDDYVLIKFHWCVALPVCTNRCFIIYKSILIQYEYGLYLILATRLFTLSLWNSFGFFFFALVCSIVFLCQNPFYLQIKHCTCNCCVYGTYMFCFFSLLVQRLLYSSKPMEKKV